ncbi:MAG: Uma2 family endonuclease [Leptospiraceae bacterium]|nr:Uma2 family endonuclease [Leptospiraceae bacterium]MCP5496410.1 Uma2 family endonuclease [Leptospiraceae bacterium]
MIIFTPILESELKEKPSVPKYDGIKMRLEEFLVSEFDDPGYKYEWNNGLLEADNKLKFSEQILVDNIIRKYCQTDSFKKGNSLLPEVECYLSKVQSVKKPDICYLTKEQIKNSRQKSVDQVPSFVIEIISPSNTVSEIEKKIHDYFQAGTKVIWIIYPELCSVKVYYSPKQIKVCTENDICDAGDVISDFHITVNEIFQ